MYDQMDIPVLPPALLALVCRLAAHYISNRRERYFPAAAPLSDCQKAAMAGYFSNELLNETRLLALVDQRVGNPAFYRMLRAIGYTNLLDQSTMAAITFSDTVVAHVPFTDDLLFHELVHVEQYRQLGISRFAELYVRGFLNGGGYDAIPLERNAYMLGALYERDRITRFSVAEVVDAWIAEGRF
jgi:hypothetical protein